jgi:DNA-binding transcriptional ArsR family regulator
MNVNANTERLDATFFALSDPTRRAILLHLAHGEASVNELTERFSISQPAISRHLKVLKAAGLIRRNRDAQRRPAVIDPQSMREIAGWIERYRKMWEKNYQRLDSALGRHMRGK